jgi:hypothetical protein
MGKGILIVVLGMSVIIGFFILKLNANSKENQSTTVNMFEQTQARLIANSGVEVYLEKLKADNTMLGNTYTNNSLFGGTYDVNLSGPDSAVLVRSTATFMGVTHTSIVKAQADKLPFFPVPGAMYIAANSVSNVKISGNIKVNGYDHDINGNLLNNGNVLPGIAVDNPADVAKIKGSIKGSAEIDGTGGKPSVQPVTNGIDWEKYAMDVESNPDIIINSSTNLNNIANLGTLAHPKSTFVNGDITFNKNLEGCGILVVNGNLTINGTFTYRGIIIAYKDSEITTKLNGNGKVYGAMIIAGTSANLEISNGNFNCFYSQAALTAIGTLIKARRFNILSWWE